MQASLSRLLHRWFPERQILIRDSGAVRAARLRQSHQLAGAGLLGFLLLWMVLGPLACLAVWRGESDAASQASRLQQRLQGAQARLSDVAAHTAALAADSAALRRQAVAAISDTQAQMQGLDAQTRAEIAKVNDILRATGLPSQAPPAPADPQDHAAALRQDLRQLASLSAYLNKLPLAAPLARMDMTSPFGPRPNPWTGLQEFHVGIDLRGPIGTPVFATAPGVVSFAGAQTGYGTIIIIDHGDGLSTRYSHLQKMLVSTGQHVERLQPIGLLGNTGWSTGPHLLYETRLDGEPLNPLNFLKASDHEVQD